MNVSAENAELRAMKLSVALYILVFALKLIVYLMTGVMALLGEALHTLGDIFIYAFLLVATVRSRWKPDALHMFGYGRAQNVASLVAATLLISFTSYKLYEEAIPRLFRPQESIYQNLALAIGVIVLSMLIAAVPMIGLFRQKDRGAAAKAQLMALFSDQLGLAAALVGTLFILSGRPIADPIATIIVATIIAIDAVALFRENSSFLLGRSPGPEFLATAEREARAVDGVLAVHDLRAEHIGPDAVHVGMHIAVRPDLSVSEADRIAHAVEARVHQVLPSGYCLIHVDPAKPEEGGRKDAPTL